MGGMTRLFLLLWAGVTVSTAMDLYKRIFNGQVCDNNQRHHHVNLKLPGGEKAICGGTLISDRWILTAAHCNDTTITAHLGLHPQKPETEQNIPPMKITDPPVTSPEGHDIMLLKLPKAAQIQPAALPTTADCKNRPEKGAKVQIAGYGPTVYVLNYSCMFVSDTLLCANTEIVKCDHPGADIGLYGHLFCGDTQTVSAMPGDSGGGVMYNNKLYGVISEGGGHPYPMYFMDICEYLPWISETMKKQ